MLTHIISCPARRREIIICTVCVRPVVRACVGHAVFSETTTVTHFYPTALKGCQGIVFTHGVRMGGRAAGNSLSGLYLRNPKV